MSNNQQELELTSGHKDQLLAENGGFGLSVQQLMDVCDMDNRGYTEAIKDPATGKDTAKQQTIDPKSSKLIMDYGGLESIAQKLKTNLKSGISKSNTEISERQAAFGKNSFPPPKIKTIMELIAENFEDFINQVLCAAAVVSIIIGYVQHGFPDGLIEGTSIMIALNIIIIVNSGNNWMSEKRLADLVKLSDKQYVAVFRGSTTESETIDANDLVVGDLVVIEKGMKVPADMIMTAGQDISCIEADLTGEPDANIKKVITENNLQDTGTFLAKSLVATGEGMALVLVVGTNTQSGKITLLTQKENAPTHLQAKLGVIASKIGNVGVGCALLTFFSMVTRTALEMVDIIPCGCGNIFDCHVPPPGTCTKPNFVLDMNTNPLWGSLLDTVIIAITVIVVAIPEGLPLAVTISLSFASKKMQKENNLVRTLSSAETMGGATHICTDKTGTLTLNKMTVMAVMAQNDIKYNGATVNEARAIEFATECKDANDGSGTWQMLKEGLFWNSSARIETNKDPKTQADEPFVLEGNVTEQGIIKFFMKVMGGQECIELRNSLTEDRQLALISFSSSRKRASIVVKQVGKEGAADEVRIYTKGAPDMLFEYTSNVRLADGTTAAFDDTTEIPEALLKDGESSATGTYKDLYERTVHTFATQAYRTILMSYRDMSMDEFTQAKADNNDFETEKDRESMEVNLTAYGIFGLQDPLRDSIKGSIEQCKTAGITTIMCTGDNIDTAKAISINAGIITQEQIDRNDESQKYSCMNGKDFRMEVGGLIEVPLNFSEEEQEQQLADDKEFEEKNEQLVKDGKKPLPKKAGPKTEDCVKNMKKFKEIKQYLRVLARSSPEDKRILVIGIQKSDGVVAVTGDGTNDAPALTKADVGFAMGITGTDVAKGACDIVLLDDNFSSIITALKYGRNVFDNVRKFLQFQLTVNVVAMFIVFFGSVIIKDSPLNAVQMLWVNLIMDTFAALALATEPPADDILTRQPYDKDAAIMSKLMWRNVFGHAVYQIIVLIIVIFVGQGTVVYNYSDECFDAKLAAQTPPVYKYIQCGKSDASLYNPFFAKKLYYDGGANGVIAEWTKLKLQQSDYDQSLLDEFSCFAYQQGHLENSKTCAQLQKQSDWAKYKVTPADVPKMTGTMKLLHFTYVFQIFVFMQLFNQFNARLLEEGQFNIFAGVFNNWIFVFITLLTFIVQLVMVEIGGVVTKCYPLNTNANLICLAFGSFEMVWGILVKLTPLGWWQCYNLDGAPQSGGEKGISNYMKKSSKVERKLQQKAVMTKAIGDTFKQKVAEQQRINAMDAENSVTINN